ncbi:polyamine ABC transporter substrate-binding protein [Carnobacterium gallinarum]|uniref:ABC transporter substrate-binding protein n=1 Tax=Carnobacterium gallinarum TaxID=2749 RepID=UPI000556A338|nr:ABC transporter substrate-binding protein [Carnobacterium gallinarum]
MKKFGIVSTLILASGLVLGACGSSAAKEDAPKELVISTFGLSEEVVKSDVFAPFEKENNVKIVVETGTSSERYTKLENNPNSNVDVIELSQSNAAKGVEAGLFEKLDASKVKNMDQLTDAAKEVSKDGAGPAYSMNSIGIVYNKEKAGKEIKEWSDLWDSSLKGKVSIPDIATTYGPAMLYLANDQQKGNLEKDKGTAAFKGLTDLAPNVVKTYGKSSDLANMFKSGEIVAAVVGDFAVPMVTQADANVAYVVPKSGTYANFNTINVTKNSKNKELAEKFIDWRISQELQEKTAKSLNEAPTNKNVTLDDETAKDKTYGAVAERAKVIDFDFVNANLKNWIDKWNKTLNQ